MECIRGKVSNSKGLANHTGPKSCVRGRNPTGEALTGERAGWVGSLERRIDFRAPTSSEPPEGHPARAKARAQSRLCGVKDPRHARKHFRRESGEPVGLPAGRDGVPGAPRGVPGRKPGRYAGRQPEGGIRPEKSPNKPQGAQGREGRPPVEGKGQEHPSPRTQSRRKPIKKQSCLSKRKGIIKGYYRSFIYSYPGGADRAPLPDLPGLAGSGPAALAEAP